MPRSQDIQVRVNPDGTIVPFIQAIGPGTGNASITSYQLTAIQGGNCQSGGVGFGINGSESSTMFVFHNLGPTIHGVAIENCYVDAGRFVTFLDTAALPSVGFDDTRFACFIRDMAALAHGPGNEPIVWFWFAWAT